MGRKIEKHMPSDRPGMLMRKRLLDLLHEHDEEEVPKPMAMDAGALERSHLAV
jgi:hypothetical protein